VDRDVQTETGAAKANGTLFVKLLRDEPVAKKK
jgi:hypothetical protein